MSKPLPIDRSKSWPWPWPEPVGLGNNGPAEPLEVRVDGCTLRISPTDQRGCDSGRIRYRVECLSCGTLVHEGSTSAPAQVNAHLRDRGVTAPNRS